MTPANVAIGVRADIRVELRALQRAIEMILYHFTDFYNSDHPEDGRTILKEGHQAEWQKGDATAGCGLVHHRG